MSELSEQRLAICKECEFYKARLCMKCGCFMPAKTKLKNASCPIGKWSKEGKKLPWEA